MWHTDPTFRGMLLSLAADPPDPQVLGPLADLLEERGDPRSALVRRHSLPWFDCFIKDSGRFLGRRRLEAPTREELQMQVDALGTEVIYGPCLEESRFYYNVDRVLRLFPEGPEWRYPEDDELGRIFNQHPGEAHRRVGLTCRIGKNAVGPFWPTSAGGCPWGATAG